MKLLELPGVGSRLKERLLEHFGSEERALEAVSSGDVASLCRVLSERQALSLVQYARGEKYGVNPGDFLATDEGRKIYQMLISCLAGHAHTAYARQKIASMFPSSSPVLLIENRRNAQAAQEDARRMQGKGLEEKLSRIRPLREKPPGRVRERAVAATSAQDFQQLKARGLDRLIDLHLAESPQELMAIASGYSQVSVVGEEADGPAGTEQALSLEIWYLVPEAVLGFYEDNLETLQAALAGARRLQDEKVRSFAGLDDLERLIGRLGVAQDAEVQRLSRLISRLAGSVSEAVSTANQELKRQIEGSSITLGGMDILQVMSRGEGMQEIFKAQMRGIFQEVLLEARARAARELEISGPESVWLDEIFSSEVSFPLELNRQALRSFEQDLRSRKEERGLKARRELARGLADKREAAEALVHALMEFDCAYAIGQFAMEAGLCMPEIAEEPSLCFLEGKNLFLKEPEAVSYSLGMSDHPEKVALLSGVNSGGKTSLLDLIAQIAILAHMGLPVPAKQCRIGLFQEMYYFSKGRGTLSAGAFETAMRKFAVVENQLTKLVLADELESITEPGASARIIACMLDELNQRGCVAVFVSHLAEEVRRFAETPVRVDGIEASGLDEENRLIVNRSPRYSFLARSTPELILDRLVRSTKGPEREFYSRLLAKFR